MHIDNDYERARKTFFWYRVYVAALGLLYLAVAIVGGILLVVPVETKGYEQDEVMVVAVAYAILGAIFFIVSAVAFFLPAKPYNWVVGLVMLAIGMTSCCFWPAVIPLLIYWVKPETQRFFGRK